MPLFPFLSRVGQTPSVPTCCVEPLEGRCLLSAVPWPVAAAEPAATTEVYVNQFGRARLPLQSLPAGAAHRYQLVFDDPGAARISTAGTLRTQLALYQGSGSPRRVSAGGAAGGAIISTSVQSKEIFSVAVRARDSQLAGTYGLSVAGVEHAIVRNLVIRPKTGAGGFRTTISSPGDADFYEFTATRAGNWRVSIVPQRSLDATLNVFDAAGNPIGGTFTSAISAGGAGATETWTGKVAAGQQYFIRIDGQGGGMGYYQVRAQRMVRPAVSIRALTGAIAESGEPGQFLISRSNRSDMSRSLAVQYAVVGGAINAVDYAAISGTAIIPAGRASTRITIAPVSDGVREPAENVGIILLPDPAYGIGGRRHASVLILDGR